MSMIISRKYRVQQPRQYELRAWYCMIAALTKPDLVDQNRRQPPLSISLKPASIARATGIGRLLPRMGLPSPDCSSVTRRQQQLAHPALRPMTWTRNDQ
ncbi:hypothetical protein ABE493_05070 [Stenotrophomonas terrae]|uniref:hypothetical protein n=1 Tax=Stenotrophomonas terrae TaxID=405446 RepID=UPI00320BA1DF